MKRLKTTSHSNVWTFMVKTTSNAFTLFTVQWQDNKIGDKSVASLKRVLRINKTLKELDLSGNPYPTLIPFDYLSFFQDNKIGNKGVKAIAKGIKFNTSLESLNLSGGKGPQQKSPIHPFLHFFEQTTTLGTMQGAWLTPSNQTPRSRN